MARRKGAGGKAPMTPERILDYIKAVYATIKHKRMPVRITEFRKAYGISPHIHSAMLANGIIFQDRGDDGLLAWIWLADEPSLSMATRVYAGYKARIDRYMKNAALLREEEYELKKAMERLVLMKKGADNKAAMDEVFLIAKAASEAAAVEGAAEEKAIDGSEDEDVPDQESEDALHEIVEVREERKKLIDPDYATLEERVMALMALNDEKFAALDADIQKLLAYSRRLLKLHGADGVE